MNQVDCTEQFCSDVLETLKENDELSALDAQVIPEVCIKMKECLIDKSQMRMSMVGLGAAGRTTTS